MLTIKDRVFELDKVTFGIHVHEDGTIIWLINISTVAVIDDRGRWKPSLGGAITNPPLPHPYDWRQFVFDVPHAYVEATEEYPFTLYVFGHHDVYNSRIVLTRQHGNVYHIDWQGRGDVHYDEAYDTGLELTVRGTILFDGIQTMEHDEAVARKHIESIVGDEPLITVKAKAGIKYFLAPMQDLRRVEQGAAPDA
ncbi:MAG: hypothetical protein M3R24_21300 [Chloroflexota bacterium]|nr:hypothetical protein [Chloroflexota bacterium]